jgi:hypothetical protein
LSRFSGTAAAWGAKDRPVKSDYLLLLAAFVSFLLSIYLWFTGQRQEGIFVGIWVPSILALGSFYRLMRARP